MRYSSGYYLDMSKYVPTGRPRGNPNWQKSDHQGNPGGVVKESNKTLRKALLSILSQKPGKEFKPKTKGEQVAFALYEQAMLKDSKVAIQAIKEVFDRADGKSAPSKEEQEAISNSGKVIVINRNPQPVEK